LWNAASARNKGGIRELCNEGHRMEPL
jgi:hypothetical protein